MMIKKYFRLFNTIKFLKKRQLFFRLYYVVKKKYIQLSGKKPTYSKDSNSVSLTLVKSIHIVDSLLEKKNFTFLNLTKEFDNSIDWNYSNYGKLWTYNLTYFDFLSQEKIKNGDFLIENFIENIHSIQDGMESFPISLRGVNWIKYLSYNNINKKKINDNLYAQYYLLYENIEYHLLGNHLLENAFSLLFGAYYFQDSLLYEKAKKILLTELEEQILADGAHFELTPMYHQIMLFRVLDSINLIQNNQWKNRELLSFLLKKASFMLSWLNNITYNNGSIPLLNDSAEGIAPTSFQLQEYAKRLKIKMVNLKLKESGYRKVTNNQYECIVDVGKIGADYIPGHAHSDTFNFELKIKGEAFIVDSGISTYETNSRRNHERSTKAHNTVEIKGQNQSNVWAGFRVANRASITYLKEENTFIEATHDGYKNKGIYHTRKWNFLENSIIVKDTINKEVDAVARLHFHPSVTKHKILQHITVGSASFTLTQYQYTNKFNFLENAYMMEIPLTKELIISINIQA